MMMVTISSHTRQHKVEFLGLLRRCSIIVSIMLITVTILAVVALILFGSPNP